MIRPIYILIGRNSTALYEYVYDKYENPDAVMMYETTQVKDALDRIILKAGVRVLISDYLL